MDITAVFETSKPFLVATGLKVLGAIVIYIVGRMLIGLIGTLITKGMYFDTNKVIRDTFGAAGYPAAEAHLHLRHRAA